jgi:peptidoglycan/LPS O-acetylase OafA/YrhL
LAALAVLSFHAYPDGMNAPTRLITRGYLGVDFFFMLSGVVLAHVYGRTFAQGASAGALAQFYWSRIARIYPVYLATSLPTMIALSGTEWMGLDTLLLNLALLQAPLTASFNVLAWSVSAEWYAYLLFPLVVGRLLGCGRYTVGLLGLLLLATLAATTWRLGMPPGFEMLARVIAEFATGMLVYRAYVAGWAEALWRRDATFLTAALSALIAAETVPIDLPVVMTLPALLLGALHNGGRVKAWLCVPPFVRLGEASYSLYLGQWFAIAMVSSAIAALPVTASTLPIARAGFALSSFAIGLLLHRFVERPCRDLLRAFPRRAGLTAGRAQPIDTEVTACPDPVRTRRAP